MRAELNLIRSEVVLLFGKHDALTNQGTPYKQYHAELNLIRFEVVLLFGKHDALINQGTPYKRYCPAPPRD